MTAEITQTATGWVVACEDVDCPRPLRWTCGSEQHAINLAAKHNREHHHDDTAPTPDLFASYDVTAAARAYLAARALAARGGEDLAGHAAAHATVVAVGSMWSALTGLTGQAAVDAAEHAVTHQITAHCPPF